MRETRQRTSQKRAYVSTLRQGEKEYDERNPITSAKMLVRCLKSNIEFFQSLGWDTSESEQQLIEAKARLKIVLASDAKDTDYDENGNLKGSK